MTNVKDKTTAISEPERFPRDQDVNEALALEMGLSRSEYQSIILLLQRVPSYAELGVYSVMWSEHCSYKSSRAHLRRLPSKGPKVVQGPGENAGAVDIGDGFCAVFKMESHNHPSYIEPYQGAATGVGGILRDVFTMGARPVASLNSLRFGEPTHAKTSALLKGVVAGIGGYGNAIGVPTVGGEVQFDKSYNGNILVNAFTVGIAESKKLFLGTAEGVGNSVIYVGAKTGRDGIHGATMASAEFAEGTEQKLPTVQVGDPYMEKILLEACLEIFATDCLVGVQDMGAAGLTSSSVEMAARAGKGIELNMDWVPRRTKGLTPYELLLSESQERMLMVAKPGREQEVFDICNKWDIDVAIIGRVTDTGRFVCVGTPDYDPWLNPQGPQSPVLAVNIPVETLTEKAPVYERPMTPSKPIDDRHRLEEVYTKLDALNTQDTLLSLLSHPNVGSRQWICRQFDHVVRNGTILRPGEGDAAVVRVFCERMGERIPKYLALSSDCNGRFVSLDPYVGAMMAVSECVRNLACTGAEALGLTDCLNFGSPMNPTTMWQLSRAVDGIRDACVAFGVPVVSGNVSLYNETHAGNNETQPILPTPTVAVVGQLEDLSSLITQGFKSEGDAVLLIGDKTVGHMPGSELFTQLADGRVLGTAPAFSVEKEKRLHEVIKALNMKGHIQSAHDLSDGGLAVALCESAMHGALGANITLPPSETVNRILFSEEPSRVLITVNSESLARVMEMIAEAHLECHPLGTVSAETLCVNCSEGTPLIRLPVSELVRAYESAFDMFDA